MTAPGWTARLAIAATGRVCVEGVIEAARAEGWDVSTADSLERLREMVDFERCDAVVVAADTPRNLQVGAVHELLGHVSEAPVFFLFPPEQDTADCQAMLGVTLDQVWNLDTPPEQLMEAVGYETRCVMDNRPEYTVICVDDDPEFLASLRELLLPNLKRAFRRLTLNVRFFVKPLEALAEVRSLEEPIAAVICDQVMPEMQGLDLLEKITELCPGTQRVLLTGYAGQDSAVRAVNDKLLDKYLTKPIDEPVDFVNIVRHLIQEYHLQQVSTGQRQRTMSQFEFIREVTGAANPEKVPNITTRFLLRQLRTPWTALFLWDADGFVLVAEAGQPPDLASDACQAYIADLVRQAVDPRSPHLVRQDTPASRDGAALSSAVSMPLRAGKDTLGIILAGGSPPDRTLSRDARLLMSFVADVAGITLARFKDAEALESYYIGTMASLMDIVEAKDPYTRGHTERVAELAVALGKAISMPEVELKTLYHAASLHDLGKLAVPEEILRKPGRLTSSDYTIIKEHPGRADTILSHLRFLDSARMIIRSHHERYDGRGYPDGLTGEEIPLSGRILAIVDSYDAMTSTRSYRNAMPPAAALAEIRAGAGTQFEPRLAAVFVEMMERLETTEEASDEKQLVLTEIKHS